MTKVLGILQNKQTREIKQNTIKSNSTPRKQSQILSQSNKKVLKIVAAQGVGFLN